MRIIQAPSRSLPAAKLTSCLTWLQNSRTCHTLKELEKALPSAASINGIQVKDYIQSLSDDNLIRIEKIGSGNWYWSFPSEERVKKEELLRKSMAEREKVTGALEELKWRVKAAEQERGEEDEDILMRGGNDRKTMLTKQAALTKELDGMRTELSAYCGNDPVEMETKRRRVGETKAEAEKLTEQILSMEGWFQKQVGGDKGQFLSMKQNWYGDEFDEEEGGLREL